MSRHDQFWEHEPLPDCPDCRATERQNKTLRERIEELERKLANTLKIRRGTQAMSRQSELLDVVYLIAPDGSVGAAPGGDDLRLTALELFGAWRDSLTPEERTEYATRGPTVVHVRMSEADLRKNVVCHSSHWAATLRGAQA